MPLLNEYFEILAEEGYRPRMPEDNEPVFGFKHEGSTYWLSVTEEDPNYLQIRLRYGYSETISAEDALRASNEINETFKVVKVFVEFEDRDVVFTVEAFYADSAAFVPFVNRSMDLLDAASDDFFNRFVSAEEEEVEEEHLEHEVS